MVLDKLINSMKLNPDEYDEYDDEYDTEEYLDEKPKKKVFAKPEEEEYYEEAPKVKTTPKVIYQTEEQFYANHRYQSKKTF